MSANEKRSRWSGSSAIGLGARRRFGSQISQCLGRDLAIVTSSGSGYLAYL